jgi:hypothetical protein
MRRFVATFAWVMSAALAAADVPNLASAQVGPFGAEVREQRSPTQKGRPARPSRNGRKRARPPADGSPDELPPDGETPREKPPARAPKDVETALA